MFLVCFPVPRSCSWSMHATFLCFPDPLFTPGLSSLDPRWPVSVASISMWACPLASKGLGQWRVPSGYQREKRDVWMFISPVSSLSMGYPSTSWAFWLLKAPFKGPCLYWTPLQSLVTTPQCSSGPEVCKFCFYLMGYYLSWYRFILRKVL